MNPEQVKRFNTPYQRRRISAYSGQDRGSFHTHDLSLFGGNHC